MANQCEWVDKKRLYRRPTGGVTRSIVLLGRRGLCFHIIMLYGKSTCWIMGETTVRREEMVRVDK